MAGELLIGLLAVCISTVSCSAHEPGHGSDGNEGVLAETLPLEVPASHKAHADAYNALFQRTARDGYGWSGGDHAASIELPFCSTCPTGRQVRHLWLFGDSRRSTVDSSGFRVKADGQPGSDPIFGNAAALTYHADRSPPDKSELLFDWDDTSSLHPWMPLSVDTETLGTMNALRIAVEGYQALGFQNQSDKFDVSVFETAWADFFSKDPKRAPIYEYYNAFANISDYKRAKIPNGAYGFSYQRIAFYVLKAPVAGQTRPLYRYFSSMFKDVLLSTSPNVTGFGYADPQLLGHVYRREAAPAGTFQLNQYFRFDPTAFNGHHHYTTRRNDNGHRSSLLMWPSRAVVIDNDLVLTLAPVTTSEAHLSAWEVVHKNLLTIIKDVHRPYSEWGKTLRGSWDGAAGVNDPPRQYLIAPTTPEIRWGTFFLKDPEFEENRIVYIYGNRDVSHELDKPFVRARLYVARVIAHSAEDVADFSKWQYYSDGGWSSSSEAAAPSLITSYDDSGDLREHPIGPDFSIVEGPDNNWAMAYSGMFFSPVVNIATAPSPTGPWTMAARINFGTYENEQDAENMIYYAANAHAGLAQPGPDGGLLISYVRSAGCWANPNSDQCSGGQSADTRADTYLPRFINLPWSTVFAEP